MDNLSAGILPSSEKEDQIPGIIPRRHPLQQGGRIPPELVAGLLRNTQSIQLSR
jgi:hypothetical protein